MSDFTAELVGDAAGLATIAAAWQELWQRVPTATPFQSPAWLLSWWRSFRPGTLAAVAIRQGERLVGFAPLYVEHGRTDDRILPLGIGVSDYLDLLIDPESAVSLDSFLDPLRRFLAGWRSCDLEELPPWSSALALPLSSDGSGTLEIQSACPVLAVGKVRIGTDTAADTAAAQLGEVAAGATKAATLRFELASEATEKITIDRRARVNIAGRSLPFRLIVGSPVRPPDATTQTTAQPAP